MTRDNNSIEMFTQAHEFDRNEAMEDLAGFVMGIINEWEPGEVIDLIEKWFNNSGFEMENSFLYGENDLVECIFSTQAPEVMDAIHDFVGVKSSYSGKVCIHLVRDIDDNDHRTMTLPSVLSDENLLAAADDADIHICISTTMKDLFKVQREFPNVVLLDGYQFAQVLINSGEIKLSSNNMNAGQTQPYVH